MEVCVKNKGVIILLVTVKTEKLQIVKLLTLFNLTNKYMAIIIYNEPMLLYNGQ